MTSTTTVSDQTRRQRLTARIPRAVALAVAVSFGVGVLFAVAASTFVLLRPTEYSAEALLVVTSEDQAADAAIPIASVWAAAGNSTSVQERAAAQLRIQRSDLAGATTVSTVESAPVVSVAVRRADSEQAEAWANGVAGTIAQQSSQAPVRGFKVAVVTPAVASREQATSPVLIVGAAGALGLLVGLAGTSLWARRPWSPGAVDGKSA